MICTDCGKRTDGQPIALVFVVVDTPSPPLSDNDFTGIVWCRECAPAHNKSIVDDFARRTAADTPVSQTGIAAPPGKASEPAGNPAETRESS